MKELVIDHAPAELEQLESRSRVVDSTVEDVIHEAILDAVNDAPEMAAIFFGERSASKALADDDCEVRERA